MKPRREILVLVAVVAVIAVVWTVHTLIDIPVQDNTAPVERSEEQNSGADTPNELLPPAGTTTEPAGTPQTQQ